MGLYVQDWIELIARWFHVIVGAAWIGTSFYFNWLNNNLRPPESQGGGDGVGGELWAVHGGGFYRILKYKTAPEKLPATLHWFKWEAYLTWVSGVSLLCLVYYFGSDGMLLPGDVTDFPKTVVAGIGFGSLIGGWLVYDLLCKSPLKTKPALVTGLCAIGLIGAAYGFCQIMGARAAFIHVGAMMGTCMAANVFFVIIPGQRAMVDAMERGDEPDPARGKAGALRSLHNNYFTLPVLFIMVSSHYPMTYGHPLNWVLLVLISVAGAATRHWFNLRGQGHKNAYLLPIAAVAMFAAAFIAKPDVAEFEGERVSFSTDVMPIIQARCTPCHAQKPTWVGYTAPQGGVLLETSQQIQAQAQKILQNAVMTNYMPLGNLTKITDEERQLLGRWVRSGAQVDKP